MNNQMGKNTTVSALKGVIQALFLLGILPLACAPVAQDKRFERISELEIKLTRLEQKQIDLERNMERTNERIDRLTELISELRLEIERIRLRMEVGIQEKTPQKITRKEAPAPEHTPAEKIPQPTVKVKEEPPTTEKPKVKDAETAYREAIELYSIKKLHEARDAFVNFIKDFPENKYTDNAFFWIGKIYQELGNESRAEEVYKRLVQKCEEGKLPDCNKLPDTYYQLMKIYTERGNQEEADKYYTILLEKFPTSDAAVRAREQRVLLGE